MQRPARIAVVGATGRMGRAVARLAADDASWELVGGIARDGGSAEGYPEVSDPESAGEMVARADAVIDFSSPGFLARFLSLHRAALAGRALVVGTTGLEPEQRHALEELAAASPVLTAANFSIAVNLLSALAERAARALGPGYDVEIVEAHHRRKVDAPSGTALELGRAVARGRGVELDEVRRDGRSGRTGERPAGEIGFHALRGGNVTGEHRVLFLGDLDRLELYHLATDRALFADGALRAARWLVGRDPGLYAMRDVLGLGDHG